MTSEEVLAIFREAGAYLEGHFILTSGLRSPVFLQKARVFMHPHLTERLCKALAERIREEVSPAPDYVVGPAIGGLIPAYETSRHLGAPAIWVERENGVFRLRRFEISPGDRVVIVEDIVTTSLSMPCHRNWPQFRRSSRVAATCSRPGGTIASDTARPFRTGRRQD